jgi:hypothetical protein
MLFLKRTDSPVFFLPMTQAFSLQSKPPHIPRALPWAGMNQAVGLALDFTHFMAMTRPRPR